MDKKELKQNVTSAPESKAEAGMEGEVLGT